MGPLVYGLCALAAATCAALLLRAYLRVRIRLLLWSAICFACLTINNVLIAVDLVLFPSTDLFLWRNLAALLGVVALLYGLIWEAH
jgi:hypothetical protein